MAEYLNPTGAWPLPAGIAGGSTGSVLDVKMPLAPSQLVTVMLTVTITDAGGSQVLPVAPVKLAGMDTQIAWYGRPLRDPLRDLAGRSDGDGCRGVSGEPGRGGPARTRKRGPRLNGEVCHERGHRAEAGRRRESAPVLRACAAANVPQEPAGRGSLTGTVELQSTAKGQK